MFSINGVALDNPQFGWVATSGTKPLSAYSDDWSLLSIPGRDGDTALGGRVESPSVTFEIMTPETGLEALGALFASKPLVLVSGGRGAECVRMSYTPDYVSVPDGLVVVSVILRLTGVYRRDVVESTTGGVAVGSSTDVSVFSGISAPVRDALIRVSGAVTGLKVAGGEGSWFTYGQALPAGSYLRFDSDTGRAWVTGTDSWVGGVEVTGLISNGPGPYVLSIVPVFTDPTVRAGVLTVTTTTSDGAQIQVRGKGAYVFAEM